MKYPLQKRPNHDRLARRSGFGWRHLSSPLRRLPDFVIAGAMKSGTTTLYTMLTRHPKILPAFRKEVHYFDYAHFKGKRPSWYRAHFPLSLRSAPGTLTGEASPSYMFKPEALKLMGKLLPKARIIIILRNPVERTISQYFHEVRMGRESLPIEKAIKVEEERLAACGSLNYESAHDVTLHASYKSRGIYVDQIQKLLEYYPREQLLVLGSGSLFEDPQATVDRCYAFLGLERAPDPVKPGVKNKGSNRVDVPPQIYRDLNAYFEPHNGRLFELLGQTLNW